MDREPELVHSEQLAAGRIEVWQCGSQRWLAIDGVEQSRIHVQQPEVLASSVYHAFLAVLLFIDTPDKVLLAGSGGAALARFLHHKHPQLHGDAVEISPQIADIAREFFDFPVSNWHLTVGDIRQWHGGNYDLIFADIGNGESTPDWITSKSMLAQFRQQMTDDGVLLIDLLPQDATTFSAALNTIREVFECRTVCLSVPEYSNIIVMAFNAMPAYCEEAMLEVRAEELMTMWGFDYEAIMRRLYEDNPRGSGVL